MRWSSDSAGSRPTKTSASWIAPEMPARSTGGADVEPAAGVLEDDDVTALQVDRARA